MKDKLAYHRLAHYEVNKGKPKRLLYAHYVNNSTIPAPILPPPFFFFLESDALLQPSPRNSRHWISRHVICLLSNAKFSLGSIFVNENALDWKRVTSMISLCYESPYTSQQAPTPKYNIIHRINNFISKDIG